MVVYTFLLIILISIEWFDNEIVDKKGNVLTEFHWVGSFKTILSLKTLNKM